MQHDVTGENNIMLDTQYSPQRASQHWCSSVGEASLSSSMQTDGSYTPEGASVSWCSSVGEMLCRPQCRLTALIHLKEPAQAGARQWVKPCHCHLRCRLLVAFIHLTEPTNVGARQWVRRHCCLRCKLQMARTHLKEPVKAGAVSG
eukprot:5587854-Karenia_brevis.AAC.1